jgi:hypothetical protein
VLRGFGEGPVPTRNQTSTVISLPTRALRGLTATYIAGVYGGITAAAIKISLKFGIEHLSDSSRCAVGSSDPRIEPLATLCRSLPMDANMEWPSLLGLYKQPKKCDEI